VLIELEDICKVYQMGQVQVQALREVTLGVEKGELVAIMGPSGSGKSTLMNIVGCLDQATSGRYRLSGSDVSEMSDNELADVRNREIGFVFQNYNLLARTSALDNVELPLIYKGVPAVERRKQALDALDKVGLKGREHHDPSELSGGQQQRVAIARALVGNPQIILADEPTGNLDTKRSQEIMELLDDLNIRDKITIVMVTHEKGMAKFAHRVIWMVDGQVERTGTPEEIFDHERHSA